MAVEYQSTGTEDSTATEGGNITVSGSGVSSGDLLIAEVIVAVTGSGTPDPGTASRSGGWNVVNTKRAQNADTAIRSYMWSRVADGSGSDALTATSGNDSTGTVSGYVLAGRVHRFTGQSAEPTNDGNYGHADADTSLAGGSLTIAQAGSLMIASICGADDTTYPTTFTESSASLVETWTQVSGDPLGITTGSDCAFSLWYANTLGTGDITEFQATMNDADAASLLFAEVPATTPYSPSTATSAIAFPALGVG